jgi:hypothetical protein
LEPEKWFPKGAGRQEKAVVEGLASSEPFLQYRLPSQFHQSRQARPWAPSYQPHLESAAVSDRRKRALEGDAAGARQVISAVDTTATLSVR